jgi:uncharacterized protein YdeI (YjbR/CyaY-like superfamily)
MEERILARNPDLTKQGTNISKAKYETVRQAIVTALQAGGEMTFEGLAGAVEAQLAGRFDGSIAWYYTTVKLDLEARGGLARVPGSGPQRIRLVG